MSNLSEARTAKKSSNYFHPRRLGHANLFVSDYNQAAEFYKSIVGYEEVYRQPDNQASFLSNGNTYHDLALTDVHSKYAANDQRPGIWHLAFELETEKDMVDGYNRAQADGVPFSFVMDHDVARSLYLSDPDGNMVEIYADVEKEWRALRQGIIVKDKPKWIPGVTSVPLTEKNYPQDPELVVVKDALFHPKKITHVALVTNKFEELYDYYSDIVGLTAFTGTRDGEFAVLQGTASGGALTLYRNKGDLAVGLHHVGFEVWDEDDLRRSRSKLSERGVALEREIDHAARHSVVVRDGDGLRLQFFVDKLWTPAALAGLPRADALYLL